MQLPTITSEIRKSILKEYPSNTFFKESDYQVIQLTKERDDVIFIQINLDYKNYLIKYLQMVPTPWPYEQFDCYHAHHKGLQKIVHFIERDGVESHYMVISPNSHTDQAFINIKKDIMDHNSPKQGLHHLLNENTGGSFQEKFKFFAIEEFTWHSYNLEQREIRK